MAKRVQAGTGKASKEIRQRKFANEVILNGGNGTQAAIAAGYAPSSAHVTASQLIRNPKIAAAVEQRRAELLRVEDITADRIKLELGRLATSDLRKLYNADGMPKPMSEWDDDSAAAVAGFDVDARTGLPRLRVHDKPSALDKLARIHGLYEKDNQQRREDLSIQIAVIPSKKGE